MEIKKIISIIIIIVLLTTSCNETRNANNSTDMEFYNFSKTSDLYRLPLVKPHELISADRGFLWFYKGNNIDIEVDSIGISDLFIVIYSSSVYKPKLSGRFEQWLVINHTTNEAKTINTLSEYESFKKNNNITVKLYSVNEVFDVFNKSLQLPSEWKSIIKCSG